MNHNKALRFNISIFIFIILFISQTKAQQQVVANSGGNIQSGNVSLSWTLGEPLIKTISGSNYSLTQGFHQPNLIVTGLKETPSLSYEIDAYPNPVTTTLILHIENPKIGNMSFAIISNFGTIVKSGSITDRTTNIPVQELVPSIYFLRIYDKNKSVKTFKIVKH